MRTFVAIAALLVAPQVGAQMFKCTDKAGKITYSSTKCSDLGLKDAGEVRERLQVTPAPAVTPSAPPPPAATQSRPPPVSGPVVQPDESKPAAEDPANPNRRCFTTNVGGKSVTRCNDRPADSPEPAQ